MKGTHFFARFGVGTFIVLLAFVLRSSAQIVITEIHYHPVEEPAFNTDGTPFLKLTNDVHEFVEIQNTGGQLQNISGWSLSGGISYTFPTNATIAAGGFRVIAKNPSRLATVYTLDATDVLGPYGGYLSNNHDTVRLRDAAGNEVDVVAYDSKFPWAESADALGASDMFTGLTSTNYQYKGRSLQRVSVTWPSADPANWLASPLTGPTPGSAQAVTRTIPKPVVIAQTAAQTIDGSTIVRANNEVTVNCAYSATNGLSKATLEYFVDNVNSTTEPHTSVSMRSLGGGRYQAVIPGQANLAIVRYRFTADRGDGLEVVSPRTDSPQIAPVGTGGTRQAWHGYFVTPIRTTTNSAIHDVFISSAALTTMANNITQSPNRVTSAAPTGLPRDIPYVAASAPQWNGTVPGVFASDGKIWDVQIRYHGSKFHRKPSNLSYKVHFPNHQPYNDQSSWFETLHGPEFIEAQKINRLLGLPASKMRQVDWYLNGTGGNLVHSEQGEYAGEMLDAYHQLQQQLNPGSTREETGELYKNVGNRDPSQNSVEGPYTRGDEAPMLTNTGWTQLQRYDWTFTLQNNGWKGPKPVRDLIEGMWTARGDTPATHNFSLNSNSLARTRAWFTNNWDVDTTLTSLALLEWMSIWDDAAQNHFFWRRASGKWVRLGWDYDLVMSTTGSSLGGTTTQTIFGGESGAATVFDGVNWWKDTFYKCFRAEYTRRLWELNNSFFDPSNLTALGLPLASNFAKARRSYVNSQLSTLGTYYKPSRPTNSYPANGGVVTSMTNLVTSTYSHPQGSVHYATQWEIRTTTGDYEEPVLRQTSTNNKTALPIPFDQLTYGQTYYWRATHIDSSGHPSVVSDETWFTWGASNTAAGLVVMNEILACNRNTIQNGTEFPDYIELRNNSSDSFSLAGYSLTDDPLDPNKFIFPSDTMIASGAYLLIWCDKDTNAPGMHSGFGLNSDGQTVLLMNGSTIADSVSFGPQAPDVSIGRIANGMGGWQANLPTPGAANSAKALGSPVNLRINEWMANPAYGDDWFEIYNTSGSVVALAGLYLSDTPDKPTITQIPPLSFIAGRGFTRFYADGSPAGTSHANFKLKNSGENIVLTGADGVTTIDSIAFDKQAVDVSQGRLPNGGAAIISFSSQTASPGYGNWAPAPVYINEILANATSPLEDAIEVYNPTGNAVNLGGWWLSDDLYNPTKFQIPGDTIVPPHGYAVFYESAFNSGDFPFALNARGDEVLLSAVDATGSLTGYGSLARFGASAENTSFGRVPGTGLNASSGGAEYWPQKDHTFGQDNPPDTTTFRTGTGAANSAPKLGPIIINEIMYHPIDYATNRTVTDTDDSQDEFVELYNVSGATVDLSGWRFKGDSEFLFPSGASLAAGAYALLVSFDPTTNSTALAAFRAAYSLPEATPIYGPYSEKLANSTFDVEIAYPAMVNGSQAYVLVDKVEYRDIAPWPSTADGSGFSLQRISRSLIGNTAANWIGAAPTPGAINAGGFGDTFNITSSSPLAEGVVGVSYTNLFTATGGVPPYAWAITSGSVPGMTLSSDGTLTGIPTAAGSNTITVQATDTASDSVSQDFTIAIAASALAITTDATLPGGTLNSIYSQSLEAAGGIEPYTWTVSEGSLPGGVTLNGAGVLSGTPTHSGNFTFTAQLADSGGLVVTKLFTVSVALPPLTINSTSPLVDGQQGTAYSQALTGAGGLSPYTWTLFSGALPEGLSLSPVGDITGTPTVQGRVTFIARLTDSASNSVDKAFTITVISPTLRITETAISDSVLGSAVSGTLNATGGTPPYAWNVVWGALPDGLSLNRAGSITGTVTAVGTFSFIVQVADDAGATAQAIVTVAVRNHTPIIFVQSWTGGATQLLIQGDTGPDYQIEFSTNLVDWTTCFTTNAPSMPFFWTDGDATNTLMFYRALMPLMP